MVTVSEEKFARFKKHIDDLHHGLQKHASLRVQLAIDDSYYMQTRQELLELEQQWKMAQNRLSEIEHMISSHYRKTYCRWRKDARWLSRHLREQTPV